MPAGDCPHFLKEARFADASLPGNEDYVRTTRYGFLEDVG
jgi:hypothetical protein